MSSDDAADGGVQRNPGPTPARAPRSRKSAKARIHPVDDPDAWRNAVLPDPEPVDPDTKDPS